MLPVLGYWQMRGRGEPIRLLLAYCNEEFIDKRYVYGTGEDAKKEWHSDRYNHGLDFPNVPYYIDGDVRISQSNAILRYIARKHNMWPTDEMQLIRQDIVADEIADLRAGFQQFRQSTVKAPEDYDALVEVYRKTLPMKFANYEKFIGCNQFLLGDKPLFPDFHLYEMLDIHLELDPNCLNNYPNLKAFHQRVQALPGVSDYLNSPKFQNRRINKVLRKWK